MDNHVATLDPDTLVALTEVTRDIKAGSTVTVLELAERWDVTAYVAKHRLMRAGVTISENASGKLIVAAADVAGWTADDPPDRRPATPRSRPQRVAPADVGLVEDTPRHHLPTANVSVFVGQDSERVRRLLLALVKIRELSQRDDDLLLLAVHSLADYAIEAES